MLSDIASMRFGSGKDKTTDSAQKSLSRVMADMLAELPDAVNTKEVGDSHRSAGHYPIHRACDAGNIHALKVILGTPGVKLEARKNNGCTALHSAIYAFGQGSVDNPMAGKEISPDEWEARCLQNVWALLDKGADVSANHSSRFWSGFDPLMACVSHSYSRPDVCLPIVRALLGRGALLNSQHHETGATALLFALWRGHPRCAELLLLAGADPTLEGHMGPEVGRVTAVELAERVRFDKLRDQPEDVVARVATVMLDTAGKSCGLNAASADASTILRCGADLRRRARLTELVARGRFTDAHKEHVMRAHTTATELLQSEQFMEARVAYSDALLWGVLGPEREFECLNNLIACLCMGTPDLYVAKQLATTLCERFPQRAGSWLQMGKVCWELEEHGELVQSRSATEGFASEASAEARRQTRLALEDCLRKARAASDAAEFAGRIASLAKAAGLVERSPRHAEAEALYIEGNRILTGLGRTPGNLAKAIDLFERSMRVGGPLSGPLVNSGSTKLELATCLGATLRGSDNLLELAGRATVIRGSELRVTSLMHLLAARMPTSACEWIAAAAKLSRSWRAAAIHALHRQALKRLTAARQCCGPAHELGAHFNHVAALASLGRFDEARAEGRALWAARLRKDAEFATAMEAETGAVELPAAPPPLHEDSWAGWARKLSASIRHGGRLKGLCAGDLPTGEVHISTGEVDDAAETVRDVIDAGRDDIREALLTEAEARRARGASPRVLSRLVLAAEEVGGTRSLQVPPALLRAISGWAGERGAGMSCDQLDDLWGSMLHNVRRSAAAATAVEDAAAEEMRRLSFLPAGLVSAHDSTQPPRPQHAGSKGKKAKKKKGGKRAAAAAAAENSAEEESRGEESGRADGNDPAMTGTASAASAAAAEAPSAAAEAVAEPEECSICLSLMPIQEHLHAPCSGRHALCGGCWVQWRAETLKQGTEFSCPMCRECLEGWEPRG